MRSNPREPVATTALLPGPYRCASIGATVGAGAGVAFGGTIWAFMAVLGIPVEAFTFLGLALFFGPPFSLVCTVMGMVIRRELKQHLRDQLRERSRPLGIAVGFGVSWTAMGSVTLLVVVVRALATRSFPDLGLTMVWILLLSILTTPYFLSAGALIGHLIAIRSR